MGGPCGHCLKGVFFHRDENSLISRIKVSVYRDKIFRAAEDSHFFFSFDKREHSASCAETLLHKKYNVNPFNRYYHIKYIPL